MKNYPSLPLPIPALFPPLILTFITFSVSTELLLCFSFFGIHFHLFLMFAPPSLLSATSVLVEVPHRRL